jgi:peptide/nickel transport system permease protein
MKGDVTHNTLLRRIAGMGGAVRFALVWLGLLATVAAWAPLLANSLPLWVERADGRWAFPLFAQFTAEDVAWWVGWWSAVVLLRWRRISAARRLVIGLGVVALTWGIASALLKPSPLVVYDTWRQAERAGEVRHALWVPIPYSPKDYLRDYGVTALEPPLAAIPERWHWLGTDDQGGDVASRMIHASRIALSIGFIATGVALVIGVTIGAAMGYFAGWIDLIGMRLVEIFEAVPTLFLLLTFVAFFERSLPLMMVIIGLTAWPGYARYTRAEFLRLRGIEFVQGAIASGLPMRSVLFRHMLPNAVAPLAVAAAFGVASAILAEATLSFLGLGLVDEPSWGQMLNQAVKSAAFNWWLALFPGGAILMTVLAYNLLGEALRDALDPRLERNGR